MRALALCGHSVKENLYDQNTATLKLDFIPFSRQIINQKEGEVTAEAEAKRENIPVPVVATEGISTEEQSRKPAVAVEH